MKKKNKMSEPMRQIIRQTITENHAIGGSGWKDFSEQECIEAFGGKEFLPRYLVDFFQHTN